MMVQPLDTAAANRVQLGQEEEPMRPWSTPGSAHTDETCTILPAKRADQISPHDMFAAAALAGILSSPQRKLDFPSVAHLCFEIADEMMREREEYGEQN